MESSQQFISRKNQEYTKKKPIKMKDISRKGKHIFEREAWTFMTQHNLEEKVFVIERLRRIGIEGENTHKYLKAGDVEYRIGYYMIGKNGKVKGKWTWGQYCPMIPQEDFKKLIDKAIKDKVIS
ncbi:MAG: hypothetical protein UT33_C0009G0031 [Candidatus Peregrinibacteria bacterium GW2011_GWC2_39_14]|nr:MAG: hypothetical protein US92_C0005G0031 [Candidatus Peregrinibacteria bacterium GW2011_GWA2_38_36]KKR06580.1 MAG: hypothetical protein UT33_C0009G0031 [Candidatus Peregrinibacteria bacterium GW2011_GWC2_39_14]